jgi:Protein of unknown function (DUF2442)
VRFARRSKKISKNAVIEVVEARLESGYKLKIRFSDGTKRLVNFEPFLKSSSNPMIRLFLDPQRFSQFSVREGDLMWGAYELCFPVADLYENRI